MAPPLQSGLDFNFFLDLNSKRKVQILLDFHGAAQEVHEQHPEVQKVAAALVVSSDILDQTGKKYTCPACGSVGAKPSAATHARCQWRPKLLVKRNDGGPWDEWAKLQRIFDTLRSEGHVDEGFSNALNFAQSVLNKYKARLEATTRGQEPDVEAFGGAIMFSIQTQSLRSYRRGQFPRSREGTIQSTDFEQPPPSKPSDPSEPTLAGRERPMKTIPLLGMRSGLEGCENLAGERAEWARAFYTLVPKISEEDAGRMVAELMTKIQERLAQGTRASTILMTQRKSHLALLRYLQFIHVRLRSSATCTHADPQGCTEICPGRWSTQHAIAMWHEELLRAEQPYDMASSVVLEGVIALQTEVEKCAATLASGNAVSSTLT
ncbi:hypothetical protein CALVIDRAFT_569402 [Calocera viscosa TUFC12733]|uniref:Uncharacterized protein n=1 Tax=Calocera viscosa (strain TUFC12733) TaxID=1330018 RepID=A0A167G023_CALVF|nr:hypothetical protein CALVIDRAFT_569402 [Calocera viscosa TUFC12733]